MSMSRGRPALGRGLEQIARGRSLRVVGGSALSADRQAASPSASPASSDGWTRAAWARAAFLSRAADRAELERLRERVSQLERDLRGVRADLSAARAAVEAAHDEGGRRAAEAARAARHEAHRSARHGGRLPSILAIRRDER